MTRRGDEGAALVTVLGVLGVVSLLATAMVTLSFASDRQGRMNQDWHAALAAAEAGADDYLARLNAGGDYFLYSAANPPEVVTNDAFETWTPVAETGGAFTYDARFDPSTGTVQLRVSGRSGSARRHIRVTYRTRSPLDYVYLSNYETTDPAAYTTWRLDNGVQVTGPAAAAEADIHCRHHRYEQWVKGGIQRTGRDSRCRDIYWYGDASRTNVNTGRFHTNDGIAVEGTPVWEGMATTSWNTTAAKRWHDRSGGSAPEFLGNPDPANPDYAPPLDLPPSNQGLLIVAENGGCLYTGPTAIVFNPDGTLAVTSPYTTTPGCVGPAVSRPFNGVLYVQDVPASAAPASPGDALSRCLSSGIHPLGYPVAGDDIRRRNPQAYNCRSGDVFVSGTYREAFTVAAANTIIITDDLKAARGTGFDSPDLLGLIANQYVEIYHPVACTSSSCSSGTNLAPELANLEVHAAILALQHSFRVQSHDLGAWLRDLRVVGTIAQQFRGAVGTFGSGTGYSKAYTYDHRLAYRSPPYLIDRRATLWKGVKWAECEGPCGL